jgi:hypothetical protein
MTDTRATRPPRPQLIESELRRARQQSGLVDDLGLGVGAVAVLAERYLLRDERGRVTESAGQMMDRAAACVAQAEEAWRPGSAARWAEEFAGAMRRLEFLPNSPTLMNAGTCLGLLSGCVVLPLEDSLASIFTVLGQAAPLHQADGGTGYSFARLRPRGEVVASTGGAASGPVSFLTVFNTVAGVLAQGGRRRGASMAVLDVCHPDIGEFIDAKQAGGLEHFNGADLGQLPAPQYPRRVRHHRLQRLRGPLGRMLLHEPDQRVQHHHAQDPERQHQVRRVPRRGQEVDQERQPRRHHQRHREHVGQLGGQFGRHRPPPRAGQRVRTGQGPPPGCLILAQAPPQATQRCQGRGRIHGQDDRPGAARRASDACAATGGHGRRGSAYRAAHAMATCAVMAGHQPVHSLPGTRGTGAASPRCNARGQWQRSQ